MEKRYRLELDYDVHGWPEFLYASDLLDLVRLDARRFVEYPKIGGMIVIKRTLGGYHLEAPHARLTREEQDMFTLSSHCDTGYAYWSLRHGRATLRIGEKTIVRQVGDRFVGSRRERSTPQVIEVVKPP